MNKLKKEYFEFGPWLSEIRDESDITHQFEHIKEDILNSELAFKVPVDKEFRSVKEGELLYVTVIAIDDSVSDAISDRDAVSAAMSIGDIVYVKVAEDILTVIWKSQLKRKVFISNTFLLRLNLQISSSP